MEGVLHILLLLVKSVNGHRNSVAHLSTADPGGAVRRRVADVPRSLEEQRESASLRMLLVLVLSLLVHVTLPLRSFDKDWNDCVLYNLNVDGQ